MTILFELLTGNMLYAFIGPGLLAGCSLMVVGKLLPNSLVQFKIPSILLGLFLTVFFIFYAGKYTEESKWKLREAEQLAAIQLLKANTSEVTVQIVTKYVDRVKLIEKEKLIYANTQPWLNQTTVNSFPLPNGAIRLLDSAASGNVPDSPSSSDGTASEIKIDTAVTVITENYIDCRVTAERLTSLQEWVRTQHSLINGS